MSQTKPNSREELEQKLLADKSFQHILKLTPQSQRELMTFELAKYFDQYLTNQLEKAKNDNKSFCGCPMCTYHSEAYALQPTTNKESDTNE